jgi:2,4-dienoyl-CoA reductase-like NADH-dependent reductase (Old Yellow Enzyme family)
MFIGAKAKIAAQLFNAERTPCQRSFFPWKDPYFRSPYRAMMVREIGEIVCALGEGVRRAREAEFFVLQIDGAHGEAKQSI